MAVPPPSLLENVEAAEGTVNVAYRLVDGRIAERWAIRDELTMLRQFDALHP